LVNTQSLQAKKRRRSHLLEMSLAAGILPFVSTIASNEGILQETFLAEFLTTRSDIRPDPRNPPAKELTPGLYV